MMCKLPGFRQCCHPLRPRGHPAGYNQRASSQQPRNAPARGGSARAADADAAAAGPAAATQQQLEPVEVKAFRQLVGYAGVVTSLDMSSTPPAGFGLSATRAASRGEVLMRVPRALCLVLDYDQGLQLPEGQWPRVREGVTRDNPPLTWDFLLSLALMDGVAGDAAPFWVAWCQAVLPPPDALCLPLCWSRSQLQELQHEAIIQAALVQQERLRTLFPSLSEAPAGATGQGEPSCSWLAWAFACVRSRAFKLGDNAFAFIPFLDVANHKASPNSDFRLQDDHFELVAVADIAAGDEVTITYAGAAGYTNQRWQAQYGFVPRGNTADRVDFEPLVLAAVPGAAGGSGGQAWPAMQLARLQDRMGDELFAQAVSGHLPYLCAALRSLPWQAEEEDATAASLPAPATSSISSADDAHLSTARALLQQCEAQLNSCATSMEEDEQELATLEAGLLSSSAGVPTGQAVEVRRVAALQYRLERKRLLTSCVQLLRMYC